MVQRALGLGDTAPPGAWPDGSAGER
jgi:hypothetical protein